MAIIIPSKHIYGDRQNAKVRDNVIERIEVNAKEVVPDNDYETPVHNESVYSGFSYDGIISNEKKYDGVYFGDLAVYSFYKLNPNYNKNIKITIPKLDGYHWISEIFHSFTIENEKKAADIKKTIHATIYNGTISTNLTNIKRNSQTNEITYNISYGTPIYTSQKKTALTELSPSLEYEFDRAAGGFPQKASISFNNIETLLSPTFREDSENYYLEFVAFTGYEEIKGGGYYEFNDDLSISWEEHKSECAKIVPEKVEFTIYGNTIGIDLTDKTVYINGELQKKVHSIDGNELMQTSNYYNVPVKLVEGQDYKVTYYDDLEGQYPSAEGDYGVTANIQILNQKLFGSDFTVRLYDGQDDTKYYDTEFKNHQSAGIWVDNGGYYIGKAKLFLSNQNAINKMFSDTQAQYAMGKETATIRCSISDYYEQNGDIVISISNSTNKMSFQEGDIVIPMVYGVDGQDRPMSTYQDGTAKQFMVLGAKKFFDGAVWQELYLQEIAQPIDN